MNFLRYLSNRSQELITAGGTGGGGAAQSAEMESMQAIFTVIRWALLVAFIPVVFAKYFWVLTGRGRVPAPTLELAQLDKNRMTKKQAKKLGMSQAMQ